MASRGPGKRTALTREIIVDACIELLKRDGAGALSLRKLGLALGADPTAVYRHFRNKDELLRAVGDRIHALVTVDLPLRGSWRTIVREICRRLRAAHLEHPDLAALVRAGPPLHDNEFELTEALLLQLHRAGLALRQAVLAYHAIIELTVASAAIDAPVAALGDAQRGRLYRSWQAVYADLESDRYPHSVAAAAHLYATSADDRFTYALDRLLDGITP